MLRLIDLSPGGNADARYLMINVDAVDSIEGDEDGHSVITLRNGRKITVTGAEADEVMKRLGGSGG